MSGLDREANAPAGKSGRTGSRPEAPSPPAPRGAADTAGVARETSDRSGSFDVEKGKKRIAGGLHGIARALRSGAAELEREGMKRLAAPPAHWAARLDDAATNLLEDDLEELHRSAQNLARRRPVLFLAGALIAGTAVGRLLRSSKHRGTKAGRLSEGSGRLQ